MGNDITSMPSLESGGDGTSCYRLAIVDCNDLAVSGVKVWLSTTADGETQPNNSGYQVTDTAGEVTFCLTLDTLVYVFAYHVNYDFETPQVTWNVAEGDLISTPVVIVNRSIVRLWQQCCTCCETETPTSVYCPSQEMICGSRVHACSSFYIKACSKICDFTTAQSVILNLRKYGQSTVTSVPYIETEDCLLFHFPDGLDAGWWEAQLIIVRNNDDVQVSMIDRFRIEPCLEVPVETECLS